MKLIKTVLILIAFTLSTNIYANTTQSHSPHDLKIVFEKVKDQYPALKDMTINFYLDKDSQETNAYSISKGKYGEVHIDLGMYNYLKDKPLDQAAGLLGHELGHIAHGDTDKRSGYCNKNSENSIRCEKEADYSGRAAAVTAGYACNGTHDLFVGLLDIIGDSGGGTHPRTSDRIKYTQCNANTKIPG